ncbi:FtsX-like permease family protein [Sporosarcina sp. Sa2YVA2]|uniref:FtsX-like permease family protein n=1 Tax=Sporosarcina quadrami TaxID=2762234 RepID=A0ABR8UBF2_9BACL|nr:FtsX-like permease family protein [Sporosarcina quadrami]MBD7985372.1 FtsX-like permease family protein [Sporosarcina quadrami]
MTLFDLVIRSMRKNIKHYYLYFFALIFSVVLYFVFATLQHDPSVVERSGGSMGAAFKVAGILLLFIAGIFVVYANSIFLKRRSREIGLYQLIGLTKSAVARLLIIENTLLSAGALAIGIGIGILVSRVFLLLLMKLVGFDGFIELTFSMAAVTQTVIVFLAIIMLTSIQMLIAVRRTTLLGLFNAEKQGEHPKKPKAFRSAFLALLGIGLIGFGYWLSGRMMNPLLFFNMLAVLGSTILGTYLLFRVTISWLFYQVRKHKQGHLGLNNSLSLAPLMHRMKGNANSLTIITVLSAMTLTMLAGAYSLYYSTEKETRSIYPHDFMFGGYGEQDEAIEKQFTDELDRQRISYLYTPIEVLNLEGKFLEETTSTKWLGENLSASIVSEKQLQQAGIDVEIPDMQSAYFYDASVYWMMKTEDVPFEVELKTAQNELDVTVSKVREGNVINLPFAGTQLVVNDAFYHEIKALFINEEEAYRISNFKAVTIVDKNQQATASAIYHDILDNGDRLTFDYYSQYISTMQSTGLLIFIAGFLGLVFLISTGSILYFKQMTEAEQEKRSYATLRQLGFNVHDIMRGIVRKQVFVFGVPLLIGLLHSIFAIKAASFMFMSDITLPASIAMGIYALIYLGFAILTVGYYRKTVKSAF